MAKEIFPLKAIWLSRPLPMLPLGGTYVGCGKEWAGWSLSLDYNKREVIITPPRTNKCGKLRVPLEWGVVYQLSTGTVKEE